MAAFLLPTTGEALMAYATPETAGPFGGTLVARLAEFKLLRQLGLRLDDEA